MDTFSDRVGAMAWVSEKPYMGTNALYPETYIILLERKLHRWKSATKVLACMCWALQNLGTQPTVSLYQNPAVSAHAASCCTQNSRCTQSCHKQAVSGNMQHSHSSVCCQKHAYINVCIPTNVSASIMERQYLTDICQGALEKIYSIVFKNVYIYIYIKNLAHLGLTIKYLLQRAHNPNAHKAWWSGAAQQTASCSYLVRAHDQFCTTNNISSHI